MADENNSEFLRQQQRAVERMMEMHGRANVEGSQHTMPPAPSFIRMPHNRSHQNTPPPITDEEIVSVQNNENKEEINPFTQQKKENNAKKGAEGGLKLDLSILERIRTEKDLPLILGLLLILWSENADRYLMTALLYILV